MTACLRCDIDNESFEPIAAMPAFQARPDEAAVRLAQALAGSGETTLVAFGTEAGRFQRAGMSSVVCGPVSIAQAHQADEFVSLEPLAHCEAFLRASAPRPATGWTSRRWPNDPQGAAMLLTADARGVYPIAPTPFFEDGRIDSVSIDRLTDFYLGIGATGITVPGQLGEAPKLEHAESVAVARQMIRRASALPVVVGVSAPGFAAMRALTHEVMAAGAADWTSGMLMTTLLPNC